MQMFNIPWRGKTTEIRELQDHVGELQNTIYDIQTNLTQESGARTGNAYKTYSAQVTELRKKAALKADWGSAQMANILRFRSYFTMGAGVKAIADPEHKRELEYVQAFMEANRLDQDVPLHWTREAAEEGKFCALLSWDKSKGEAAAAGGQVKARALPWIRHNYKVETPPDDYLTYDKLIYQPDKTHKKKTVKAPGFVYAKFGGRVDEVNETPPMLASVLGYLEALDKALWDWREINHLFGAPTPVATFEDPGKASDFRAKAKEANWKIGKLLTLCKGLFTLVGPPMEGVESIEKEIMMLAKLISGVSGIPIQFLGLPDVLSNRATADNLIQGILASVNEDRGIWKAFFTELFRKVLAKATANGQGGYEEGAVKAELPELSQERMRELIAVWLPLSQAEIISNEAVLERVPGLDVDKEKKRLEDDEKKMFDRVKAQFGNREGEEEGEEE